MGYGFGPGWDKPGKKPVQDKPAVKPPVHEKPANPKKPHMKTPPFPFDFSQFFGGKKQKKR
ncbi:hypothetical protein [Desulforamulus putei]|uniref:hypothetical protein n=1 Tax=Desulforamulus putei TaxID=74701 RepID=UPI002FDCE9E1